MDHSPQPQLINRIETFLAKVIAPHAQLADADYVTLNKLFTQCKQQGLLKLLIPQPLGGLGMIEMVVLSAVASP